MTMVRGYIIFLLMLYGVDLKQMTCIKLMGEENTYKKTLSIHNIINKRQSLFFFHLRIEINILIFSIISFKNIINSLIANKIMLKLLIH
jgi:hypothetical protein